MKLVKTPIARRALDLVVHAAGRVARAGGALARQVVEHPFSFDRVDAAATVLWPANPEEIDPPRWRLDLLTPSYGRSVSRGPVGAAMAAPGRLRAASSGETSP
jgi:hypothetical protein